jgi:AraC-like DNA-binding protein
MRDRVNQRRDNLLLWVGRQGGEIDTAPITASGYTVREVACSRQAQAALAKDRFDVILLDLSASHAVGLESLQRLTEHDFPLDVIAVNGDPCIEKAVQTVKAGAWDYLPRPLCVKTLVDRLAEHRRHSSDSIPADPVVHFVCEHAAAISTRAEVAQRFGLSPDTVSSRVRCATGKTFTEFLHACRLQQARYLLESTALNVSQVAARVGFSTSQHFARIFRRYTGLSPARYRLQRRAKKDGVQ